MPKVPALSPDAMQQMQSPNPVNFLMAAADMHNNGELGPPDPQLSAPTPTGKSLPAFRRGQARPKGMRVVK